MEFRNWVDNELSEQIWKDKYQQNNETFDAWIARVSNGDKEVADLILSKKFLFGGRILAYRGIEDRKLTYSNCYVLEPPEDSIEGIYKTAGELARTFSYGGGCGIDISNLRPNGSPVNNAAMTTSGPVSFMDTFSQVSSVIGQEGRRGALMISMDVNHTDIEEFIDAKKNTDKLEGCNISVRVDDFFMTKVAAGDNDANRLFDKLVENNWNYAEPGILYWDTINRNTLLSKYINLDMFKYAGVNPCAEEPLPAGGSCLLGAINLSEFVDNPFTKDAAFNIPEFKKAVKIGIKALNDVLDEGLEKHPLQIQRDTVKKWRQIGLGIMGYADALVKLHIPYGSSRSLELIDQIGQAMVNTGILKSAELSKKYGPFDAYNESILMDSVFLNKTCTEYTINKVKENKLRNSQLFTIAPTGSISTMLQVSGGVEPIFSYDYTRTTKSLNGGQEKTYKVVTPIFVEALQHCTYTESLPDYITWSSKLNPIDRVKTQGTWQKWIDASISSTVNLPNDATIEDVRNIYLKAWAYGCKGITIYRSGCAREGILKETKEEKPEPVIQPQISKPIDTDIEHCTALGTKLETGCGSLWITAYFHNETGQLCHLFLDKGSKGGCNSFMIGLSRTISMLGKMGVSIEDIADQLLSVTPCPSYVLSKSKNGNVSSGKCCPDAVGRALQDLQNKFINSKVEYEAPQVLTLIDDDDVISENACPECGSQLINTGGCNICQNCGWSKCM